MRGGSQVLSSSPVADTQARHKGWGIERGGTEGGRCLSAPNCLKKLRSEPTTLSPHHLHVSSMRSVNLNGMPICV